MISWFYRVSRFHLDILVEQREEHDMVKAPTSAAIPSSTVVQVKSTVGQVQGLSVKYMSLLRQAEQYVLNQKTHVSLNAFISPFFKQNNQRWLDRLVDADKRRQNGTSSSNCAGSR